MRHTPSIPTESGSYPVQLARTIVLLLGEALYHSRRLRAERTLLRYRDTIARAKSDIPHEMVGSTPVKLPRQISSRSQISPQRKNLIRSHERVGT
jgi:hypothetical protein